MSPEAIRELASETLLWAAKDYCATEDEGQRKKIIKDLNSPWMDLFTDGTSKVVAQALQNNEQAIADRLKSESDMKRRI